MGRLACLITSISPFIFGVYREAAAHQRLVLLCSTAKQLSGLRSENGAAAQTMFVCCMLHVLL